MVKTTTSLTIDSEILKQMKEEGFNMSEIAENAFKEKLGVKEVSFNEPTHCNFCGVKGKRATEEEFGLTWIYPNEKWICPKCLILKGQHLI